MGFKFPLIVVLMFLLHRDHWNQELHSPIRDLETFTVSASTTPDWLFPLIMSFTKAKEGFMRRPYICPAGMLTVGYGHVILKSSEFKTWREADASALLESDFKKKMAWVKQNAPESCKEYQLWALTMLAMNCRMHKWKKSSLREEVWEYVYIPNRSSFSELQTKWEAWSKIRNPKTGKKWKSKALVERRHLEYLIFTGQWSKIQTEYAKYMPEEYKSQPNV